ncbi:hypothetical protein PanWU01x14_063810 [Parasponia andersonii]|uniref:Uncharacterized protein n=1 Tax=Parasponia andersonii TaxID=3476 RepID=A0A2P5DH82_PARAD|nr:hypothetical protein PanWU01x14_063810 [Parasponia andersonii]
MAVNYSVTERQKVMEDLGMDGVPGRECASHVSARALVGQDPEVEFGEEASEVWNGNGGWGREGFDPHGGAYFNGVFLEERVRVVMGLVIAGRG